MIKDPLKKFEKAIKFHKSESFRFKKLIETSKTKYKEKYYKEKLKDNNIKFVKYLYVYDALIKDKEKM